MKSTAPMAVFIIGIMLSLPIYASTAYATPERKVIYEFEYAYNEIFPPDPIENFRNTSLSHNSVTLEWDPSPALDFDHYRLYRDGVELVNLTTETYTDNELVPLITVMYEISGVDTFGNEGDKVALTISTPPSPYPEISAISATVRPLGATVSWISQLPSDSEVQFGESQSLGSSQANPDMTTQHLIELTGLSGNTTYHYKVISCTGAFCNESSIRNFTVPPYDPLFLNLTVPTYHNRNMMTLTGTTTSGTTVELYTNDIFDTSDVADEYGEFLLNAGPLSTTEQNKLFVKATDSAGMSMNRTFNVYVDVQAPVLNVTPIPEYTIGGSFHIIGRVNEACDIDVFVTPANWVSAPAAVTNFSASYGSESVTLTWNPSQAEDFLQYVIYRDDQPMAAVTDIAGNSYTDSKIKTNTGRAFTYKIVVHDKLCKISSEVSSNIVVPAFNGPEDYIFEQIDDSCEVLPDASTTDSTSFSLPITIATGENTVLVRATDIAGNIAEWSATTKFDSGAPELDWHNLGDISPTYTRHVVVRGNVSEAAEVRVILNGDEDGKTVGHTEAKVIGETTYHVFEIEVELSDNAQFLVEEGEEGGGELIGSFVSTGGAYDNTIALTIIDEAGLNYTYDHSSPIRYALCGYGSWFAPTWLPPGPTPGSIVPRHIMLGIATLNIPVQLNWSGAPVGATISSVTAGLTEVSQENEANWDRDWVSGRVQFLYDRAGPADAAIGVIIVNLKPQNPQGPDGENWTIKQQEDWLSDNRRGECSYQGWFAEGDVGNQGLGCIRIPLELKIEFVDPTYNYGDPLLGTLGQSRVQKICYPLEMPIDERIDFGDINEDFLNASIDVLDATVTIVNATYYGAYYARLASMVSCWIWWVVANGLVNYVWYFISCFGVSEGDKYYAKQGMCKDNPNVAKENEAKCETCSGYYEAMATINEIMRYTCDRVYCPTIPTFDKHVKDQSSKFETVKIKNNIESKPMSACAQLAQNVGSMNYEGLFQATKDPKCEVLHSFEGLGSSGPVTGTYGPATQLENCCSYEYAEEWEPACPFTDIIEQSNCVSSPAGAGCKGFESIFFKGTGGICKSDDVGDLDDFVTSSMDYPLEGISYKGISYTREDMIYGQSSTENFNRIVYWVTLTDKIATVQRGFISRNPQVRKDSDDSIVIDQGLAFVPLKESKSFDITRTKDTQWSQLVLEYANFPFAEFESDLSKASGRSGINIGSDAVISYNSIANMLGTVPRDYLIDPTSSIISAGRCMCFSALETYLIQIRNMFLVAKECLIAIRETGDGQAGICEALISRYVCDMIWDAFTCLHDAVGIGAGGAVNDVGGAMGGVGGFIQGMTNVGKGISESIGDRYQGRDMFDTYFNQQTLGHGVCVFAFTGNWPIDYDLLFQAEMPPMDVDSMMVVFPAERRFVRYVPTGQYAGYTDWMYHFGILFQAGANINYETHLVCSADYSCDGPCDCTTVGEQVRQIMLDPPARGQLNRGEMLNLEEYEQVLKSEHRYDTFRVHYSWTDSEGKKVVKTENFPIGQEGNVPAFCELNLVTGRYLCDLNQGQHSYARFVKQPRMYPDATLNVGDPLNFEVEILRELPEDTEPCPANQDCETTKYLKIRVTADADVPVYPFAGEKSQAVVALNGPGKFYTTSFPGAEVTVDWFNPLPNVLVNPAPGITLPNPADISHAVSGSYALYFIEGKPDPKYVDVEAKYSTIGPSYTIACGNPLENRAPKDCAPSDLTMYTSIPYYPNKKVRGMTLNWLVNEIDTKDWWGVFKTTEIITQGQVCNGQYKNFIADIAIFEPEDNGGVWTDSEHKTAGQMPDGAPAAPEGYFIPFMAKCGEPENQCATNRALDQDSDKECYCSDEATCYLDDAHKGEYCTQYLHKEGDMGVFKNACLPLPVCKYDKKAGREGCYCQNLMGDTLSTVIGNDVCGVTPNQDKGFCHTNGECNQEAEQQAPPLPEEEPLPPGVAAIVEVTNRQYDYFHRGDTAYTECQPEVKDRIDAYYEACGGTNTCPGNIQWSAAFISYVMKTAGVENFPSACAHSIYFSRIRDGTSSDCKTYPNTAETINNLQPGHVLCNCRPPGCQVAYEDVTPGQDGHCSVVVRTTASSVTLRGGNEGSTVGQKTLSKSTIISKPNTYYGVVACAPTGLQIPEPGGWCTSHGGKCVTGDPGNGADDCTAEGNDYHEFGTSDCSSGRVCCLHATPHCRNAGGYCDPDSSSGAMTGFVKIQPTQYRQLDCNAYGDCMVYQGSQSGTCASSSHFCSTSCYGPYSPLTTKQCEPFERGGQTISSYKCCA